MRLCRAQGTRDRLVRTVWRVAGVPPDPVLRTGPSDVKASSVLLRSTPEPVVDIVARVATVQSPFSGREAQMATLSEQLDRASSGVGSVVLVEGDAGMGKSRLLEEVMRVARGRHFR